LIALKKYWLYMVPVIVLMGYFTNMVDFFKTIDELFEEPYVNIDMNGAYIATSPSRKLSEIQINNKNEHNISVDLKITGYVFIENQIYPITYQPIKGLRSNYVATTSSNLYGVPDDAIPDSVFYCITATNENSDQQTRYEYMVNSRKVSMMKYVQFYSFNFLGKNKDTSSECLPNKYSQLIVSKEELRNRAELEKHTNDVQKLSNAFALILSIHKYETLQKYLSDEAWIHLNDNNRFNNLPEISTPTVISLVENTAIVEYSSTAGIYLNEKAYTRKVNSSINFLKKSGVSFRAKLKNFNGKWKFVLWNE
ncbi:hypothetical protein, partial [Reichenbachiella sp.]